MTRKQRRMVLIASAGVVLVVAVGLILFALQDRLTFFNSPTDMLESPPAPTDRVRLGGLVALDSVVAGDNGRITFDVTDGPSTITVTYQGIVPDLFREGQGVITEGTLDPNGVFNADTVLAKHDEAYMPAEVVDALKEQGEWYGDEAMPAAEAVPAAE